MSSDSKSLMSEIIVHIKMKSEIIVVTGVASFALEFHFHLVLSHRGPTPLCSNVFFLQQSSGISPLEAQVSMRLLNSAVSAQVSVFQVPWKWRSSKAPAVPHPKPEFSCLLPYFYTGDQVYCC